MNGDKIGFLHRVSTLLLIFALCVMAVAYAFYSEFTLGLNPCPLCIMQRIMLVLIALVALVGLLVNFYSARFIKAVSISIIIFAIGGIYFAAYQEYLIHLPLDKQPTSCAMPVTVMLQKLPLHSFLHYMFTGSAECGQITWTIFGINPALVTMLLFIILILLAGKLFIAAND